MTSRSRTTGGAQGGRLLLAAGLFTLVNNYLPGSDHLDRLVLNTVGVVAVLLGLACLRVPWERLPLRAPLALAPVAFALISLSNLYGGVSAFSYAVYFVVVFVWVGIAQPPGTSWWLLPPAAAAYVLPFLVGDDPPANALASVTVAIPVCVLVGEVLSRSVRRLEHSQDALRSRVRRVERLAELASGLGADLDVERVQGELCAGAVELLEAHGALLVRVVEGVPVVAAGTGSAPPPGTRLSALPLDAVQPFPAREAGLGTGGTAVVVPCRTSPDPLLLCVLLGEREFTREDADVLRLLVTQAAAALTNAATHAEVVAQRAHEQAVVDVLADGVLVLAPDGRVVSCNFEAAQLLGRSCDALVGSTPPLVVGPDGAPLHAQFGTRWVETVATRLEDSDERVVTVRDVSRQRALDEAKDLFLATTSHELRTPLTAVKGYVHMLQRRWEVLDEPTRLEALATIAERTEALVTLTNHLLLGARAVASRQSAARVAFDLPGAVASAASAFTEVSGRHDVRVAVTDVPMQALGDSANVAQIVAQLVENAMKYSPLGGAVEIQVRRDGAYAVVEVLDEGVGLPEGDEASLFAPFFQAGDTDTREFGGVGLGLYIVQQLVEAMGGTVFARNREDGSGAAVGFTVPLTGEPPAPREGEAAADYPLSVPPP